MPAPGQRRHCIFTSAGDTHALADWPAASERSWDLVAAWHGCDAAAQAALAARADRVLPGQGGTFGDLAAALKARPMLLTGYDLVWVIEDSLRPDPADIERLFAIARAWNLGVCQPAQRGGGTAEERVLARDPDGGLLRFTTLVGHACPLFRRERLERFLARYDGSLEGPGLAHWIAQALRGGPATGFAVVDAIEVEVPPAEDPPAEALRARGIVPTVPQTLARLALPPDAAEAPGGPAAMPAPSPPAPPARPAADAKAEPELDAVRQEMAEAVLTPLARSAETLPPPDSPILVAVVRDEAALLPDFLRHYRAAGIRRFCFIDNGSSDGTPALLAAQPDVDLFECRRPFDWRRKHGWVNRAIAGYGHGRWYLHVDADEQLVFDGIERHDIGALVRLMEGRGILRVRGLLLDMYGDGPLLAAQREAGRPLREAFPFYDRTGYRQFRLATMVAVRGGPRRRVFAQAGNDFDPELSKLPLFRIADGEVAAHPHRLWPHAGNFASDRVLALLHFKFLPEFAEKMRRAIAEGNYWRGSLEYRCYQEVLAKQPDLSLHGPHSARFTGSAGLVAAGVIAPLRWPAEG